MANDHCFRHITVREIKINNSMPCRLNVQCTLASMGKKHTFLHFVKGREVQARTHVSNENQFATSSNEQKFHSHLSYSYLWSITSLRENILRALLKS